MNILYGILSIIVLVAIAVLISENRKAIAWSKVLRALAIQIILILFVMLVPIGQYLIEVAANAVTVVLDFGIEGVIFVFGDLATDFFIFAISVLAMICFTSALISFLYYIQVIPYLVKYLGKAIAKVLGTTEVETFCSVGNSFLGVTEAPLLTRPFLKDLTRSEMFAVLTGGFASVSVSVLGGYVLLGIDIRYLLIAIATVPFATLFISKIVVPETEESKTTNIEVQKSDSTNVFDAISDGAIDGMHLALNIGAVLIAFIGTIALLNYFLGLIGFSFESLLGLILSPIAWVMGIPGEEMQTFSAIIGTKTAMNEFVAFTALGDVLHTLSPRTQAMLTVAICNFANFGSIGIAIAGFKTFCPQKSHIIAEIGIRSFISALLTTLVTASIVGMFF